MLSIRTASVGFVQSLYLSFLASVHIFLFYSHPNPLYSHSILLTKDADPRISFPFFDYAEKSPFAVFGFRPMEVLKNGSKKLIEN